MPGAIEPPRCYAPQDCFTALDELEAARPDLAQRLESLANGMAEVHDTLEGVLVEIEVQERIRPLDLGG